MDSNQMTQGSHGPHLRGSMMWCRAPRLHRKRLPTLEKVFLLLGHPDELISDPQAPGFWSFQMLLPISEIPQDAALRSSPIFVSCVCTYALSSHVYPVQNIKQYTQSIFFLSFMIHVEIWGVLSPLFRPILTPLSLSKVKQETPLLILG